MKTWTAHLHDAKPPVLLKEGFSWGAFVFGPLWLAAHGAWIPAALALAGDVAIALLAPGAIVAPLFMLASWCLGLWGNDLRRWALRMRGFTLAHVVAARDADGAFVRLLTARPDLTDLFLPAGKA